MRKITALTLMGALILVMLSVIVRMGTFDLLIKKFKIDNIFTRTVFFDTDEVFELNESNNQKKTEELLLPIDLKKEYPFHKNNKASLDTDFKEIKGEPDTSYTIFNKLSTRINYFLKERLLPYNSAVDLALRYEGNIIKWSSNKEVFYIGSNYWYSQPSKPGSASQVVQSIKDLNYYLKEKDIPFLYVAAPNRLSPDSTYNFENFIDIHKDSVYTELKKLNIPLLDLRENINKENKNWYSLFYNTDPHWKLETALWASKIIAEKLNSDFGFDLDVSLLEPQNYNYKVYKNWFLGSTGKKVGHYMAKPDDFTLITPKFETMFDFKHLYANKLSIISGKNFDDAFVYWDNFKKINYYNSDQYISYKTDGFFMTHNKLNDNNKKIMIIQDSYGRALSPFLSIVTEWVIGENPRYFNGSIKNLIEKEKPDIVIILYYHTRNFLDDKAVKETFDFR